MAEEATDKTVSVERSDEECAALRLVRSRAGAEGGADA